MPDDRQFCTHELSSAKYLANVQEVTEPEIEQPARRARPKQSGLEQFVRWASPVVAISMIAAAGGLYWKNRESIESGAGRFRERTSSPVDFALWLGGSKKTFKEAFTDAITKAQKDSAYQFDAQKPLFKSEFEGVNFDNIWGQSWNQKHKD
jgi:hypothetical protein